MQKLSLKARSSKKGRASSVGEEGEVFFLTRVCNIL